MAHKSEDLLKALDAVAPDRVVDLKTTRDMSKFPRDAANLLYHGQMAWYLDGAIAASALRRSRAAAASAFALSMS